MIKCNLRSVEVNITLEMSKISLHGIVYIYIFYLRNFIQYFGNKAGSRVCLRTFALIVSAHP